jgi:two-component system OmpR family response regulator
MNASSLRADDERVMGASLSSALVRILLLEDDPETAEALVKGLAQEGHDVSSACDVASARSLLSSASFDAAVLDVMVPGGSGYDVLALLRSRGPRIPALMLTARGAVEDRVAGLDQGADDYLVKPFSFAELAARVRALVRRAQPEVTRLALGALELDLLRQTADVGGTRLELTRTEFSLLATLLRAGGDPVGRSELLREVWGLRFDPGTNVVDVHVNRLRRKLEDAGLPAAIRTVRGRGYAAP